MEPDETLVRKAQQGDRGAFEEIVRRTTGFLYARLYLDVGNVHDAEDLVQETFIRAWRSIAQVREPAGFRRWLSRLAQTALLDFHRRNGRKRRGGGLLRKDAALDTIPARPDADGEGPEAEERREKREKVRSLLASLPEEYRLPLAMRYFAGEDYGSITAQLGITNGALKGTLHRGLELLRKQLRRAGVFETREQGGVA